MERPTSCDTLVALGNSTLDGSTIFAKNSDRSDDEIQLVCFYPKMEYPSGEKLKCTYIEIPQVRSTHPILLSQPYWMWGGEMGCNSRGVCIGNEAVWTKEEESLVGLLGMDLLRLGLERGASAQESLNIIIDLLKIHGQGGNCAKSFSFNYHNSFIICDPEEAFVLETAGQYWAWEKVKDVRSISNGLSIMQGDCIKEGTVDYAIKKGWCKSERDFNFCVCFSSSWSGTEGRQMATENFMKKNKGKLTPHLMTNILRNHPDGICMHGGFESTGAQISLLNENYIANYFTATSCPCLSMFHPFAFDDERKQKGVTNIKMSGNCMWTKHSKKGSSFKKSIPKMREIEQKNMETSLKLFQSQKSEAIIDLHNQSIISMKEIVGI